MDVKTIAKTRLATSAAPTTAILISYLSLRSSAEIGLSNPF
jgi:hypothetical protein